MIGIKLKYIFVAEIEDGNICYKKMK